MLYLLVETQLHITHDAYNNIPYSKSYDIYTESPVRKLPA
jgi:hypothetical protein